METADAALTTAPPAAAAFDDAALEAEYQSARECFVHPAALQQNGLWLLGSLALFAVLALVRGGSIANLVILVAVLLFHELGHYVGMLGFGYRDVRMFFIPLFGAAVSGRRGTASQTREAVVLLLGPVPGIVFGVSAAMAALLLHSTLLKTISLYLLGINALNLLPLIPLDGGRLAAVVLFSRWMWSERLFVAATATTLAIYGFADGAPVLGVVGIFILLGLPIRHRVMRVVGHLRMEGLSLINDPTQLDESTVRTIFLGVRAALPPSARKPKPLAEWMTQVLEGAAQRPPSLGRSLAIVAAWGTALVLAIVGAAIAGAVR
jgi:hypothetical protein